MKKILAVLMILIFGCLVCLICAPLLRHGGGPSLESGVAGRISTEIMQFAKKNNGMWPTNWLQLSDLAKRDGYLFRRKGLLIPEAYAFVPTNLTVTGHYEGNLIVIRRRPIKDNGNKGRYFVYHDTLADEFNEGWMSEQDVQDLFSKFSVTLSEPNPEEVRAAREAVERQ
jgi:hypothetical protein